MEISSPEYAENRATMQEADTLRSNRNKLSKQIGGLMAKGEKDEAEKVKAQVNEQSARLEECEKKEAELAEKIKNIMMTIPNIIDPTVPIGKDDSENVEIERFGEPVVPDFEVPYHTDNKITHQQMYVLMYKYSIFVENKKTNISGTSINASDAEEVADWAKDAVKYASQQNFLVKVGTSSRINPTGEAKRSELAQLLEKYCDVVLDWNSSNK